MEQSHKGPLVNWKSLVPYLIIASLHEIRQKSGSQNLKSKIPIPTVYTKLQLAIKYIQYWLRASNGRGHGVHSPFVFDFIKNVLNDTKEYDAYKVVEGIRAKMLGNEEWLELRDLGAGSVYGGRGLKRKVKEVARNSLKSSKYAQLLFRIAHYYFGGEKFTRPSFLELGTSLGLTSSYFALANPGSRVFTIEGAPAIAMLAARNFSELGISNIELAEGNFDDQLSVVLEKFDQPDLAFIDGNHRKEPTLRYFLQILERNKNESIFIFDDIHWSEEMEEAWREIKSHRRVTLSIDLFFIGLVFFNPDFKARQDFTVRF